MAHCIVHEPRWTVQVLIHQHMLNDTLFLPRGHGTMKRDMGNPLAASTKAMVFFTTGPP